MKSWEMELNEREKKAFKRILSSLKEGMISTCPYSDVSDAVRTGYCNRMCGILFPSLMRNMEEYGDQYTVTCPCFSISQGHKIKVVTNLLKFNKVKED